MMVMMDGVKNWRNEEAEAEGGGGAEFLAY